MGERKHRESVKCNVLTIVTGYRLPFNTINETTCTRSDRARRSPRIFANQIFRRISVCVCQYLITLSYVHAMLLKRRKHRRCRGENVIAQTFRNTWREPEENDFEVITVRREKKTFNDHSN